eukprot:scaffold30614_cov32-Tisochrysis_lutea.AAC.1
MVWCVKVFPRRPRRPSKSKSSVSLWHGYGSEMVGGSQCALEWGWAKDCASRCAVWESLDECVDCSAHAKRHGMRLTDRPPPEGRLCLRGGARDTPP